ncbi:hypothetical protein [Salinisphaera sp. LB1]|nr:hypothetical protein [Salinisphaera sp. LB1]AWN14958.1 hypothetical protein SALB1_0751 [Salinisphaera sp. LB1]
MKRIALTSVGLLAVTPVGATCIYKPIHSAGKMAAAKADNGHGS